jgi:hypothetical protein
MEHDKNMKKHIFQNYQNTKPSKHDKKEEEIETLLSKTIMGSCLCTIVLNHNLLELTSPYYGPWV